MTIDVDVWKKNVCDAVGMVSDRSFQVEAWHGRGRYLSTPEELYNHVFSDVDLPQFLNCQEVILNDETRISGEELVKSMEKFDEIPGTTLPVDSLIDHPAWIQVRKNAERFLELLSRSSP